VISGFRREVDENCALLGCYAANSGNTIPTFRDNLSMEHISFPEISVRKYHYTLRRNPDERSSHC